MIMMPIKIVLQHPGSHSCLGAIMQKIIDMGLPLEDAQRNPWIIFLIYPPDDGPAYVKGQLDDLVHMGFKDVRLVSEFGVVST